MMRFPGRMAPAFAVLLLAAILAAPTSFAQETEDPPPVQVVSYAEQAAVQGNCASPATGVEPNYGSVASGRCTVTLPDMVQDPTSVNTMPPEFFIASVVNPVIEGTATLTIPVELVFAGTVTTDAIFAHDDDLQPTRTGEPGSGRNVPPAGLDAFNMQFALRGFISVLHGPEATGDGSLTLTVTGTGEIVTTASRMRAIDMRVESNTDVTVNNQGVLLPSQADGIHVFVVQSSNSELTIRNSGTIAGQRSATNENTFERGSGNSDAINVEYSGTGDVVVENAATGLIRKPGDGIWVQIDDEVNENTGDIRITSEGEVNVGREGIYAQVRGTTNTRTRIWVRAANIVSGQISGITAEAPPQQNLASNCFLPSGPRYRSCVEVLGAVEGGTGTTNSGRAAVRILGSGGVLVIGPQGRVESRGTAAGGFDAAHAVRIDAGPAAIVYLAHGGRVAGRVGMDGNKVDGILGTVDAPEDTAYKALLLPDDMSPTEWLDAIETFQRSDKTQQDLDTFAAVRDRVQEVNLREAPLILMDGVDDVSLTYNLIDHAFALTPETPPAPDPAARAQVYEALPSVLLSVNRPLSHDDRWSAPRADGWWMWAEAASGNWEADAFSMGGMAMASGEYDYDRYATEIGRDWAVSENAVIGLSAHYRDIDADIGDSGSIEADGYGIGVSARVRNEKTYLALQGTATWYEVDAEMGVAMGDSQMEMRRRDNVDGFGWTAGAEVGYRLEYGEVVVTPRAGLTYSEVDLDSFQGPGGRVSLEDGESIVGRAGVRVQRGGLYAAVDVEHEFSDDERRVESTGTEVTVLESEAEDTWVRAAAGGIHEWDDGRYSLHVRLSYAESDGDNDEFGGSLTLQGRF